MARPSYSDDSIFTLGSPNFCALNPLNVLHGRCEALITLHEFAFNFFISLSEPAMRLNGLNTSDKTFVHQNHLLPHHLVDC
jgi:hypothetical protein